MGTQEGFLKGSRIGIVFVSTILVGSLAAGAIGQTSMRHLRESRKDKFQGVVAYWSVKKGSPVQRAAAAAAERDALQLMDNFVFLSKEFFDDPYTDSMARHTGATLPFYQLDSKSTISFWSKDLVSYFFDGLQTTGGAYPGQRVSCSTFAMVGGNPAKLQLADAFSGANLHEAFNLLLVPKVRKMRGERIPGGEDEPVTLTANELKNWIVTKNGVTWIFPADSVAAHVEGQFVVKVPWSELASMVRSDGPLARFVAGR